MSEMLPPVLLVGCGQMGGAMLKGWLATGLEPSVVLDLAVGDLPAPHRGIRSIEEMPAGFRPAAIILAVKPQKSLPVLHALAPHLGDAMVISVMAGRTVTGILQGFHEIEPTVSPLVVRAMPNTPAAIGQGITGLYAPPEITAFQRQLCDRLLSAIGATAWVETEQQIDAVTAVSGSGPAYVFLLAEMLERAAIEQGLSPELARLLARKTVSGAGMLLDHAPEDAAELRRRVTSPGGTTEQALNVLMHPDAWPENVSRAVAAATHRSAELAA